MTVPTWGPGSPLPPEEEGPLGDGRPPEAMPPDDGAGPGGRDGVPGEVSPAAPGAPGPPPQAARPTAPAGVGSGPTEEPAADDDDFVYYEGGLLARWRRRPTLSRRALVAQARAETRMTLRRGESLLLTLGIPIMLLGFFTLIGYPDRSLTGGISTVDFLAPGILALAVMSTAMVSLSIATGFERQYGVLKRLGTTPLGRPALLAAKVAAVFTVEVLQIIVLWIAAVLMGWQPRGDVMIFLALVVLATAGFAGIGLLMAGTLRAEMTLAAANGLYLVLLLLGGMVVPLNKLPGGVQGLARVLPAANLADALHATLGLGTAVPGRAWLVLLAWAIAAPAAAAATFRWE